MFGMGTERGRERSPTKPTVLIRRKISMEIMGDFTSSHREREHVMKKLLLIIAILFMSLGPLNRPASAQQNTNNPFIIHEVKSGHATVDRESKLVVEGVS